MDEREIFAAAVEMADSDDRAACLERMCGNDGDLRRRVDSLLAHHDPAGNFLEVPPIECHDIPTLFANGDLTGASVPVSSEVSLEFLQPSDNPDSLGRLGDYEVVRVIGHGGMGVVFQGFDERLHRDVALKVLAHQHRQNPDARTRFLQEARAAAAITHPNIVTVHCVHEGPVPFIAMQFVEGEALSQLLRRGCELDGTRVAEIGIQIAAALAAAHHRGLVHRDIKPGNILIEAGTGCVKITDFGLARVADQASLTRTGDVAGTPQFMSPEQALARQVDHRTDLFSLGSTLYAMCTGRVPFQAELVVAVLRQVCDESPTPVRELNPDAPLWLASVIERLMAKQPEDRYQTADEVVSELRARLADPEHSSSERSVAKSESASVASAHSPNRWRKRHVLAAAIAGLALLLLGTEVSGVTHLTATVIRLAAGEGTLVIEVDDPSVQVSVQHGDVHFRWNGHELKLRPGDYKVQASRDGKPIKSEIVSITRNSQQLFRVTLESASPQPETPSPASPEIPIAEILTSPDWKWGEPLNLGAHVNTNQHEHRGVLTADELTMVFSAGNDLWQVQRSAIEQPFGRRKLLGEAINEPFEVKTGWLSPDGLTLTCEVTGDQNAPNTIRSTKRAALDRPFSSELFDLGLVGKWPTLTADQCTLVYVHPDQPPPNTRKFRLMVAKRSTPDAPFEPPTPFYPGNKHWSFNCPVLSADGLVLLCGVLRQQQVWIMSRPDLDSPFGEPVDLKVPIDASGQKIGLSPCWLSPDGQRLYVVSAPEESDKGDLIQISRVPAR